MLKQTKQGKVLKVITVLALISLFFVFAIGVTLVGSNVYAQTTQNSDENYTHRTAISYLVNQIWRADVKDGISIGTFGDGDAIFLSELGYVTVLYVHEGMLNEIYMEEGFELTPESGTAILPVESMTAEVIDGNLLNIEITSLTGNTYSTSLSPKSVIIQEVE